jgi:hypothetical protein
VVAGGWFVLRWPKLAWLHLPAAGWGALIEFTGWICPLTPLENDLRLAGGGDAYSGGFVAHYILPAVYPEGLTRAVQWVLGCGVILANATPYGIGAARRLNRRKKRMTPVIPAYPAADNDSDSNPT